MYFPSFLDKLKNKNITFFTNQISKRIYRIIAHFVKKNFEQLNDTSSTRINRVNLYQNSQEGKFYYF